MTQDDLGQLPREALIELLLMQAAQIEALQASQEQLQQENEVLCKKLAQLQKPPTDSKNSSQPPSLDRKSNRPSDRRKHRHGPPQGHEKHERQFIEQPDHVVEVKAQQWDQCQFSLEHEAGQWVAVNQITELPAERAELIEVHPYAVRCPVCEQVVIAEPLVVLEMQRTSRAEGNLSFFLTPT